MNKLRHHTGFPFPFMHVLVLACQIAVPVQADKARKQPRPAEDAITRLSKERLKGLGSSHVTWGRPSVGKGTTRSIRC